LQFSLNCQLSNNTGQLLFLANLWSKGNWSCRRTRW